METGCPTLKEEMGRMKGRRKSVLEGSLVDQTIVNVEAEDMDIGSETNELSMDVDGNADLKRNTKMCLIPHVGLRDF